MSELFEKISGNFPEMQLMKEEPMAKHTTFRIGGPAEVYACPNQEQLPALLEAAKKENAEVTVIGNGSNLLVGDKGIRGLVIEIGSGMNDICVDDTKIVAGAGALLSKVANAAVAASLGGMEFAAGIPGSIGGAVTMNAGAYGGEMKDILESQGDRSGRKDAYLIGRSVGFVLSSQLHYGKRRYCCRGNDKA